MPSISVMHLVVAGDIGGAERLLVDLASRPDATGAYHEVALFTSNEGLRAYFRSLSTSDSPVHDRGPVVEGPFAYLTRTFGERDVSWLSALVRARKPQLLHTHTFGSHVLGTRVAERVGLPQLRTEHHVMHYFDPSCSPFTRWAAARTDRLVAVSQYVRNVLAKTAPHVAARTTVVRNGVDSKYWAEGSVPRGPFQLGIVCRLTRWKRVHLAIAAAARSKTSLLVVGDGEERGRLETLAQRLRAKVRFVGHQTDPRPFIAACNATVSAADREPLGLSVLESLAMNRPVIAFAGGGIPEIVQHGQTGWLVSEPTVDAFEGAMREARRSVADLPTMGARGRAFVVENGNIERMCAGYAEAYRELVKSS